MKILLIEDDLDLQIMYRLQLEYAGHSVKVAALAPAAFYSLESETFDLILLDILLPEHNGISILYELRSYEDWREIPVIILSNILPAELGISAAQLKTLRVKDYLIKARTSPQDLLKALE